MIKLPKIQNANLWDQAYIILKESIIKRHFKANQKLSIPELVHQLNISNTPLRDALIRLEMEGLITTVPKVGTFVKAITREDVEYTMDTRLMLEWWVADHLSSLPETQIQQTLDEMDGILANATANLNKLDMEQFENMDYNYYFHMKYIGLGNNPHNTKIYGSLMNYRYILASTPYESPASKMEAIEQHRNIIEVIKKGNVKNIKRLIKDHLNRSKTRLLKFIDENN